MMLEQNMTYKAMEHYEDSIRTIVAMGYNREEAINLLDGKNADGTEIIELPFQLMYRVFDSLGNLMRKFSTYQAAFAYKMAYGNYSWTIK